MIAVARVRVAAPAISLTPAAAAPDHRSAFPEEETLLKKLFWIALSLVSLAIGVATVNVGCGPRKKYCPTQPDGICPEPLPDGGGGSGGGGPGDSIFLDL